MIKLIRRLRIPLTILVFVLIFLTALPTPILAATLTDSYNDSSLINTSASSNYIISSGNAQVSTYFGNGADGAITVSSSVSINATNLISGRSCADGGDAVNYSVTALTSTTATLSTTPSTGCLVSGAEIMLINLRGSATVVTNVGNYETLRIQSISTNVITFTTSKTKYYGDGASNDTNIGTAATNQKVMLQRVPNYTNVTINSGINFYPTAFNGSKGGVMFFKASGTVTVTGNIHANASGYPGGSGNSPYGAATAGTSTNTPTGAGEGNGGSPGGVLNGVTGNFSGGGAGGVNYTNNGYGTGGSGTANVGAGGGGAGGGAWGNGTGNYWGRGGGGGGGGYGTGGSGGHTRDAGTNWGVNGSSSSGAGGNGYRSGNDSHGGGGGGGAGNYGEATLAKVFLGSGGGGGGGGYNYSITTVVTGSNGGTGAGIVMVAASTLSVGGTITATGDSSAATNAAAGCGGAGSGGSIKVLAGTATLGSSLVNSVGGGSGGTCNAVGGPGGNGRIALQYVTSYTGTTYPTLNVAQLPSTITATIQSTNILSGQYAHDIRSLTYNLSAKPAGTTATIQFSNDVTNWYNSSHSINQSDTLTTGSNNNINLSAENWSGPNFYYKILFGSNGTATPVLNDIAVNYVGGIVAIATNSSNTTVSSDSYFVGVIDGTDASRIIDGVDTGTGDTNTSVITISNGANIVVNSNETLVAGSFVISSGSIVLATSSGQRAVLKPGGRLYATDHDADLYPANANTLFIYDKGATLPNSERTRRKSLASLSTRDCNDNAQSFTNFCTGNVGAACTADVQCTTPICGTDADADQLFSAALGHTGTCQATAYAYTDTNDSQYCPTGYNPAGTCSKCVNGATTYETSSEDLFNECSTGNCATGNCSGSGYSCQSSGTWTCDSCNTSCCSIDPNSHCTSTTCGTCGANCSSNGGSNYCSGFDVWNGGHTCYCHYEPTNNCNPQPCNCSCR